MANVWVVEFLDDAVPDHYIEKVFDSEAKALKWISDQEDPRQYEYTRMEVE